MKKISEVKRKSSKSKKNQNFKIMKVRYSDKKVRKVNISRRLKRILKNASENSKKEVKSQKSTTENQKKNFMEVESEAKEQEDRPSLVDKPLTSKDLKLHFEARKRLSSCDKGSPRYKKRNSALNEKRRDSVWSSLRKENFKDLRDKKKKFYGSYKGRMFESKLQVLDQLGNLSVENCNGIGKIQFVETTMKKNGSQLRLSEVCNKQSKSNRMVFLRSRETRVKCGRENSKVQSQRTIPFGDQSELQSKIMMKKLKLKKYLMQASYKSSVSDCPEPSSKRKIKKSLLKNNFFRAGEKENKHPNTIARKDLNISEEKKDMSVKKKRKRRIKGNGFSKNFKGYFYTQVVQPLNK